LYQDFEKYDSENQAKADLPDQSLIPFQATNALSANFTPNSYQPSIFSQQLQSQLNTTQLPPFNSTFSQLHMQGSNDALMQSLNLRSDSLPTQLFRRGQLQSLAPSTHVQSLSYSSQHTQYHPSAPSHREHSYPGSQQPHHAHAELHAQLKSQKLAIDMHLQSLQADRQKYLKVEENVQLRRQLQTQMKQLQLLLQAEPNAQLPNQQQYLKILQTQLDELSEFNILCVMTSAETQKDVEISIKSTVLSNSGLVLMPTFRRKPFASHV
jgi:hypothetical protein